MNFDLSEDQLFRKKAVREFTDREIEPIAEQIDQEGQLPNDLIRESPIDTLVLLRREIKSLPLAISWPDVKMCGQN